MNRLGFQENIQEEEAEAIHDYYPVVLLGFHRGARAFVDHLKETAPYILKKILVIDFNLEALKELADKRIKGVFGDISSMDTLKHAHVEKAQIILSTIPDMLLKGTSNFSIVRTCRTLAPNAIIVATADSVEQIDKLKRFGANEVLLPYSLIGNHLSGFVKETYGKLEPAAKDVKS